MKFRIFLLGLLLLLAACNSSPQKTSYTLEAGYVYELTWLVPDDGILTVKYYFMSQDTVLEVEGEVGLVKLVVTPLQNHSDLLMFVDTRIPQIQEAFTDANLEGIRFLIMVDETVIQDFLAPAQ